MGGGRLIAAFRLFVAARGVTFTEVGRRERREAPRDVVALRRR
jgi:hypothetical protein